MCFFDLDSERRVSLSSFLRVFAIVLGEEATEEEDADEDDATDEEE
jgi:hypothetical protein